MTCGPKVGPSVDIDFGKVVDLTLKVKELSMCGYVRLSPARKAT